MANSLIIERAKNRIIRDLIKDREIILGIDASEVSPDEPEKLIGRNIFDYHFIPETITRTDTFLTLQIQIPYSRGFNDKTYVHPRVEIWIVSHWRHMIVENIPKIRVNRNDYLSMLIDDRLNGRTDLGLGKLDLIQNIEGCTYTDYVYRQLIFETLDLNNSLCEE